MRLRRFQQLLDGLQAGLEQLRRVVFHPAGFGINLAYLAVERPQRRAGGVYEHRGRACRSLVEGEYVSWRWHFASCPDARSFTILIYDPRCCVKTP